MLKGKEELDNAVDDCLLAAASEFNYDKQRLLLKAASFGKLFCDEYDADHFVCALQAVTSAACQQVSWRRGGPSPHRGATNHLQKRRRPAFTSTTPQRKTPIKTKEETLQVLRPG